MDQTIIESIIKRAICDLKRNDMDIVELDEESQVFEYLPDQEKLERKLHEVCINHRLAVYLEKYIKKIDPSYHIDIEYNRYYKNKKHVDTKNYKGNVRPDIIVHKRMNSEGVQHLLIIEAKKDKTDSIDEEKIIAMMEDSKYGYKYGSRIRYNSIRDIKIDLYYWDDNEIKKRALTICC